MGLLENFQKLITEHGSSAILRDRILLLKEEAGKLVDELAACKRRLAQLEEELVELHQQIKDQAVAAEYAECRGALFKRKGPEGYDHTVRCPRCRGPMASVMKTLGYTCGHCGASVDFNGEDLPAVLKELEEEKP